jgi:acyl-CoA reductase-like NAD-dependent aldehyde dehydrogenase
MGRGLRAAAGERVARGPAGLKARLPRLTATLKNVTLELGGNDAALILDDVAVDEDPCAALLSSAFATTGQVCDQPPDYVRPS